MKNLQKKMKKYMKPVGNAISALSILFVLSVFVRTDFQFSFVSDWKGFLIACLLGVGIKTATVFLSANAWAEWLSFFAEKKCSRREALRVYAKANIGKYMPGNVMHYIERNLFAKKLAVSQKKVAAYNATLVLTAFLLGVLFAYPAIREAFSESAAIKNALFFAPIAFGILFFVAALFCFFNRKKCARAVKAHLKVGISKRFVRTLLFRMALYAAVLTGLGFIFVELYVYQGGEPSFMQSVSMIASYMAAWAVGFVVPGAPGGIGVRELALFALLKNTMGEHTVVTLGVWHRLITVIGDMAAYVVAAGMRKSAYK